MEGATSPEESSQQLSVPSFGRVCVSGSRSRVGGLRRFFVSERHLSLDGDKPRNVFRVWGGCTGALWIHGEPASLGFWQAAGHLRGAFFLDGAGAGQGPVQPGALHTYLRGRSADRRRGHHHRVLAALSNVT